MASGSIPSITSAFSESSSASTAEKTIRERASVWPSSARAWTKWAAGLDWKVRAGRAASSGSSLRRMGSEFMTGVLLWVEDDQNDILLVGRAMEKMGIDPPMVVRDGQEAIHYLSGQGKFADRGCHPLPWLILLDLKLPKRSGLEVLQWLRAQPELRRIPVIIFTSSKETSDINRA